MIFLDGVGIGKEDYNYNPFFKFGFKTFTDIFENIPSLNNTNLKTNNAYIFPSDASLGVQGFPQSGTGQASIYCGMNIPKFVGKHFGPYPYSTTVPLLKEKSIFSDYLNEGYKIKFANAYPPAFFDYLESGRSRLSVTPLICKLTGIELNNIMDLRKGRALTAEITNERWNLKLGHNLPVISADTAAKRLLDIAEINSFTLYEYYLTDHLGHGRYDGDLELTIKTLDDFLFSVFKEFDMNNHTLIICSDHGNFEDLSVKTHTLNPALTIAAGKNALEISREIKDISQIKGAILKYCK